MSSAAVSPVPQPAEPSRKAGQVERAARALIGWMRPEDAQRVLLSNRTDSPPERQTLGDCAARTRSGRFAARRRRSVWART